ncbi:MAG: hypothetical protein ACSLE7_04535 [Mycobacterium sp.]
MRVAIGVAARRNPGVGDASGESPDLRRVHSRSVTQPAIRHDRIGTILILAALCLLLSGCKDSTDPSMVPTEIIAIMAAVWKARNLGRDALLREQTAKDDTFETDPEKAAKSVRKAGMHVLFFLRSRAVFYHDVLHMSQGDAATHIGAEYAQLRQFVDTTIGTNADAVSPLIKSQDTGRPLTHLDFSDVLRVRDTDPAVPEHVNRRHVIRRWDRAWAILWRAGGLEPDLWQNDQLSEAGMLEILDRRLRMAERVLYHLPGELADPLPNGPTGPWNDHIRVRMFEYPYLFEKYANPDPDGRWAGIGPANIAEPNDPIANPPKLWRYDLDRTITYDIGNHRRVRSPADTAFVPAAPTQFDPGSYHYDFSPTTPDPATAIDQLFTAATDFWQRSWIFCDHVLCAIHLEALRFGKKRRFNNDNLFNAAVQSRPPGAPDGWAQLRPLPIPPWQGDPHAMGDDTGRPPGRQFYRASRMSDLQVGDHIIVWNSIMYAVLSTGAWSLENAVVVSMESDPFRYTLGEDIHVMGHGSSDPPDRAGGLQYTGVTVAYFRRDLSGGLSSFLKEARKVAVGAGAAATVSFKHPAAPLIQWSPFGTTFRINPEPGVNNAPMDIKPWWLVVPYDDETFIRRIGQDATLRSIPDAIEYDSTVPGIQPPPPGPARQRQAALFPLWVPDQLGAPDSDPKTNRWKAYFKYHRENQQLSNNVLSPHQFLSDNIPGFVVPREFNDPASKGFAYTVRPMAVR